MFYLPLISRAHNQSLQQTLDPAAVSAAAESSSASSAAEPRREAGPMAQGSPNRRAWIWAFVLSIPFQFLAVLISWQFGSEPSWQRPRMAGEDYLCLNWFHGGHFYPCSLGGLLSSVSIYLLVLNVGSIGIALLITASLLRLAFEVFGRIFSGRQSTERVQ